MAHGTSNKISIIIPHSIALITGYSVWMLLYLYLPITQQYKAEISFFNVPESVVIKSPETVSLALKAPRAALDGITPVIHIDAEKIPLDSIHLQHIDHRNLLVPYLVEMVYCYPSVVSITKINCFCTPAFTDTKRVESEAL